MLPPSSKYLQRSADPVDDAERESITRRLNQAFADGRISHDQYAADMDIVYAARVLGDLVPVIERLPAAVDNVPAIVEEGKLPAGQGPVAATTADTTSDTLPHRQQQTAAPRCGAILRAQQARGQIFLPLRLCRTGGALTSIPPLRSWPDCGVGPHPCQGSRLFHS